MTYDSEQVSNYIVAGDQWIGFDSKESLKAKTQYLVNEGLRGGLIWTFDLDDFRGGFCGEGKYPLVNAVKTVLDEHRRKRVEKTTTTTTTNPTTSLSPTPTFPLATQASEPTVLTIETALQEDLITEKMLIGPHADRPKPTPSLLNVVSPKRNSPAKTTTPPTQPPFTIRTSQKNKHSTARKKKMCIKDGLTAHPTDCTKFVLCLNVNIPDLAAEYVMNCPLGLGYNTALSACDHLINSSCMTPLTQF